MRVISEIDDLRPWAGDRNAVRPRVLVPTMGALHEGHLSLVDIARKRAGDWGEVVATIFVNPTQFAPHEDFDRYPRNVEEDLEKLAAWGVNVVFLPENEALYASDHSTMVAETAVSAGLEGASRPQFFPGVCTVVAKLFNLIHPDAAVFGQKDYQQLAVIRRMIRDLHFPIEILSGPTVREEDGLALSSRNAYLDPQERQQAAVIPQALGDARELIQQGVIDGSTLLDRVRRRIETQPLAQIDYVELVDPDTLQPIDSGAHGGLIAVAVRFGKTRLIDNLGWRPVS